MISKHEAMELAYEIPGQTWPSELGWIYDTAAKNKVKKYVDVGSFCGRSLWAAAAGIASHGERGSATAVDSFRLHKDTEWAAGVMELTLQMIRRKLPGVDAKMLRMSSLSAINDESVAGADFVFIDADHNYAECSADIEGWFAVSAEGAILSGHDYWPAHRGVMRAVNTILPGKFSIVPETRIWWHRK